MKMASDDRKANQQTTPRYLAPASDRAFAGGPPPSFSVVIASYQAAAYVSDAVRSALEQTVPPSEVIVCDDGSTDGTEETLRPYRDRIVFLRKENGGPASARNMALCHATGDFVAILDADDLFLPGRLEALGHLAAARPDLDIITTDAFLEHADETVGRSYVSEDHFVVDDQRMEILRVNFLRNQPAVRRERLLETGFDEDPSLIGVEDWDCWIRLILTGSLAGMVFEPLAIYRLRAGSLSWNHVSSCRRRTRVLEKTAANFELTMRESELIKELISESRRETQLAEAVRALTHRDVAARRLLAQVARDPGFSSRRRVLAAVAAVAPAVARRRLQSDWAYVDHRVRPVVDRLTSR